MSERSAKKTKSRQEFESVFEQQTRRFSAFDMLGLSTEGSHSPEDSDSPVVVAHASLQTSDEDSLSDGEHAVLGTHGQYQVPTVDPPDKPTVSYLVPTVGPWDKIRPSTVSTKYRVPTVSTKYRLSTVSTKKNLFRKAVQVFLLRHYSGRFSRR